MACQYCGKRSGGYTSVCSRCTQSMLARRAAGRKGGKRNPSSTPGVTKGILKGTRIKSKGWVIRDEGEGTN